MTIHAFFSIGNILSEGGWIREAIFAYDMVLRLKPDFAEAYYNRGTAKTFIAEYEAAIADFDTAIRRKPDFAAAYYNRGAAQLAFNQIKAATSAFQSTLKLAEQQGCKHIKTNVRQRLKELRDTE